MTADEQPTTGALTEDEVEAGARALFQHFHGPGGRPYSRYEWPPPEQHLPWWREAARAVLAARTQPAPDAHVVHVTAEPVAEDVVWCDECEEWVTSVAPECRCEEPSGDGDGPYTCDLHRSLPQPAPDASTEAVALRVVREHVPVQGVCRCGESFIGMGFDARWSAHVAAALAAALASDKAAAKAEAWPLSLPDTQRIVDHLINDGTRNGLMLGDLLNKAMGASARLRADRVEQP